MGLFPAPYLPKGSFMIDKKAALADVLRVADLHEHGVVSRSFYRDQGKFTSYEIDTVFGNFTEFKRQAGLVLSRAQSQLTNQLAKHVSFDDMRNMNVDRRDYGEKYLRPDSKRFQTVIVASDLHDKEMDPFWRHVFIDTVARVQPEIICFGGDIFDLPEFGKYSVDPRDWDVTGRIKYVHDFLAEIREVCPDAQIDLIEGNHEYRLLRHLGEATPQLKAVLSDLHGMTIGGLLGLDKYEVHYIARADMAAWTKPNINKELGRNYQCYFDTLMVDHFPNGQARGMSGFNGHHHKFEASSFYSHLRGPQMWMQLGCGHKREASYCDAERWNMGFAISHIDTQAQRVAMNYIPVSDFAEVGGKFYFRDANAN
jgi:hypothetical protein